MEGRGNGKWEMANGKSKNPQIENQAKGI